MENGQLMAKMPAQTALLDAVNAIMMVPPVLPAQPTTICQEPHVLTVLMANMHLLDQLMHLHVSLVRMPTVPLVAQATPPESVPSVTKVNSPYQANVLIVEI